MSTNHSHHGTAEQFRLLVEAVEDYAIFMIDPQGRATTWNPGVERVLGYNEQEFQGLPFARIFPPEEAARGECEHEMQTATEHGSSSDERWHIRKDGSRFWAQGVLTSVRSDGNLLGFVKILRDRTDLKELQETLRGRAEALLEADERKNIFLATLAHELRNPLSPILNAVQILRRTCAESPAVNKSLKIIERQALQLRRLVEDLLDVARLGAGKTRLKKERVELGAAVTVAVESVRPLAQGRKQSLAVALPNEPVWLEADPGRLQQILVNVLNNATKYTDEGGQIFVNASREGNEAVVKVRDTGIGIPADKLPHIFDLFTQVEYPQARAQGGLGIGLTLVRNLVELHGGTVQAKSPGPGKGSEFILRFPALDAPTAQAV